MSQTQDSGERRVPLLIEHIRDEGGTWTREWYCVPPKDGVPFVVLQREWSDDFTIERIYEIKLPDG